MAPEKQPLRAAWLSGGLAILFACFISMVSIPNIDQITIDNPNHPTRSYIEPHPVAVCAVLAMTFIPALCIFLFAKRWIAVEYIGG